MNVILVSGRYPTSASASDRHDEDAKFAALLASTYCDVRWIVPGEATSVRELAGVTVIPVRTRAPGFRGVEARLRDKFTESVLAREVRRDLPAVVHLLDYGGSMSVNVSWVASRLGVPVVVNVRAAPTLCHRGDLVYVDGTECADWADPERCAACCLVPSVRGLSSLSSWFARLLRVVRWPFSTYPTPMAFQNRRELIAGGLQSADAIVVASAVDRDRMELSGLRRESLAILAAAGVEDWVAVYDRVTRT
jgi:hypothetical protein